MNYKHSYVKKKSLQKKRQSFHIKILTKTKFQNINLQRIETDRNLQKLESNP